MADESTVAAIAEQSATTSATSPPRDERSQGGRRGECHRLAGALQARLNYGQIDAVLEGGLHDFLTGMIEQTATLGSAIEDFYIRA